MNSNMKCLGEFIVVVPSDKKKAHNGILLPDGADMGEAPLGEVVAIGSNVFTVAVGDTVLIPLMTQMRLQSTKVCDLMIEGRPALVIKEEDVAVLWPKED